MLQFSAYLTPPQPHFLNFVLQNTCLLSCSGEKYVFVVLLLDTFVVCCASTVQHLAQLQLINLSD